MRECLNMQKWGLQKGFAIPGPVGFEEGRVVDDGRKQGGEGPQQKCGEELGDDRILEDRTETKIVLRSRR